MTIKTKIRLKDVASECGVSLATVSYILNGKQAAFRISQKTITQVLATCQRLKYLPDETAVAMARLRNQPLSLLVLSPWLHTQFSDFMVQVNNALQEAVSTREIRVSYDLYPTSKLSQVLKPSKASKYDAVIVIGTDKKDNAFLRRKNEEFTNVFLLNRKLVGYPCSYGNDHEACHELSSRIIASERYTRFVLVQGVGISNREQMRLDGFQEALDQHPEVEYQIIQTSRSESTEEFCERLYPMLLPGTLIFTPQYFLASLLTIFLKKQGKQLPHEIGLASYDLHSLLKRYVDPPVTTIDPNIREMTLKLLEQIKLLRQGKTPASVCVPAQLVIGQTAYLG